MNHRRNFIKHSVATAASGALALSSGALLKSANANEDDSPKKLPRGKAKHCIFIWLGGGACHLDTWDPKRVGDPKARKAGSAYRAVDTAIPNVQVCEHLKNIAPLMDRGVIVRSVNHSVIDEHAAATNQMHVGRPPTGTTIYPSIGSVVAHEKPPTNEAIPPYVVMGYPSATRGPGFLGAKHGYIYLTNTSAGPAGLKRPRDISDDRQNRREKLLGVLRDNYLEKNSKSEIVRNYTEVSKAAFKLAGPDFMKVFDLSTESEKIRESYGSEFGQRCLLARRLVQSGVRFVEVAFNLNFINGTGWDTHNEGQENQHLLIRDLDKVLAALVLDLEKQDKLDDTLVVVATEFGRPPEFDGRGGRGHQSKAFSVAMFGGGLKTGQAIGTTDELAKKIVDAPVSVPDLHATIYQTLGIRPSHELFDDDRPVPITDGGKPIRELFV